MTVMTVAGGDVEFATYGAHDGEPVVVHHGLFGSTGFDPGWEKIANGRRVHGAHRRAARLRTVDPRAMTSIAEWAEILLPVCDALGYESFSVLGISAGAPYSYAIAARAPQRVRAVAIASGLGQVNDDAVLAHYPPEARELLHRFRTESYDEVAAFWLDYVRQVAARFEPGDRWYDLVVATGAHKAAGPTREAVLQQRPWGFALDAIECPVHLWHAVGDTDVPVQTARLISGAIPTAELTEVDGTEHVPTPEVGEAVFRFLAQHA